MDDLCHLFKTSFANVPLPNSVGWNTIHLMLDIFTNFAAVGNPGVEGWGPSIGEDNKAPLYGYNIHESRDFIGELPEVSRMEVWDTFYRNGASRKVKAFYLVLSLFTLLGMIDRL